MLLKDRDKNDHETRNLQASIGYGCFLFRMANNRMYFPLVFFAYVY
ncbi:hypothetical protein B4113_0251 [Geobacillus sp. B4113_201601]|nr:hypothetical protein B4113_0251 [Geobacillus sp. B4113_201601]